MNTTEESMRHIIGQLLGDSETLAYAFGLSVSLLGLVSLLNKECERRPAQLEKEKAQLNTVISEQSEFTGMLKYQDKR